MTGHPSLHTPLMREQCQCACGCGARTRKRDEDGRHPHPTIHGNKSHIGLASKAPGASAYSHRARYNAHLPRKWNGCGAAAESSAVKVLRVSQVALAADNEKLRAEIDLLAKKMSENEDAGRQVTQLRALTARLTEENKKLSEDNALLSKRAQDTEEENRRLRHLLGHPATVKKKVQVLARVASQSWHKYGPMHV